MSPNKAMAAVSRFRNATGGNKKGLEMESGLHDNKKNQLDLATSIRLLTQIKKRGAEAVLENIVSEEKRNYVLNFAGATKDVLNEEIEKLHVELGKETKGMIL